MKHLYTLLFLFFLSTGFAQVQRNSGEIEGFKLFPNPVTEGTVNILTSENSAKNIRVYDVLGTPVLETTIMGSVLNLSELSAGIYLIQVFEKDKVATRKLIVK